MGPAFENVTTLTWERVFAPTSIGLVNQQRKWPKQLRLQGKAPMLAGLTKEKLRPDDKGEKSCVHRYLQLP